MNVTREVPLGERTVTVKELTVAEIRQWLADVEGMLPADPVDGGLFEEVTLADVRRMSDLTAEAIEQLGPSEIRRVIDAAKELNPDFFGLRTRLTRIGQVMSASGSSAT